MRTQFVVVLRGLCGADYYLETLRGLWLSRSKRSVIGPVLGRYWYPGRAFGSRGEAKRFMRLAERVGLINARCVDSVEIVRLEKSKVLNADD